MWTDRLYRVFLKAGKSMFWKRKSSLSVQGSEFRPLPDIDGETCVHSISVLAQCQVCVDACPEKAIILNDEMLGLDENACTSCGLCQAVCPQSAITVEADPVELGDILVLVCEKVKTAHIQKQIRCVHQIGLEQLAGFYQKGIRKIAMKIADCPSCHYYGKIAGNKSPALEDHCRHFNLLVRSRGLEPLALVSATPTEIERWNVEASGNELENLGRRKLFTGLGDHLAGQGNEELAEEGARQMADLQSVGNDKDDTIFFAVPNLDQHLCDGCDACVRICPTQALTKINEGPEQNCYKVHPQSCTGCGLCRDVCAADAVNLRAMTVCETRAVPLQAFVCTSCGVTCHVPEAKDNEGCLCRVCAQAGQHKKLFQVLK